MAPKLEDRINALAGENPKTQTATKIDRRHFNKKTPGSGRKPKDALVTRRGIKEYLESYFNDDVEIQITDPKTGVTAMVKQPRVMLVLEKLYEIGMTKGDPDALNKWLDRALGKPKQVIDPGDAPPFQLQVNIVNMLNRAYGNGANDPTGD